MSVRPYRARRRLIAGLLSAGLLLGVGAASVAAVVGVTFQLAPCGCIFVQGAPSTTYTISVLDGTETVARSAVQSDADGWADFCPDSPPVAGMRLRAQTTGYSRTVTVPALSVRSDRVTDAVSGVAPAGAVVDLYVERLATGTYAYGSSLDRRVTIGASGTFSVSLKAAGGIRGGDYLFLGLTTGAGDSFGVNAGVESMRVSRGSSEVSGAFDVGGVAELVLRTSTGALRGRAHLTGDAPWGRFRTATGVAVAPRTGDRVVGGFASDAVMTVPAITVTASAASDAIRVTCPGMVGRGVRVSAERQADRVDRQGVTDASGVRSWDVTTTMDLKVGDRLVATCRFDNGDEVFRRGVVGP